MATKPCKLIIFHYFGTKILYFTRKKYQKSKIFSIEILLRMICQQLMSNDTCNFVILYMVCKFDKIFHENYWSKMGSFINDFDGKWAFCAICTSFRVKNILLLAKIYFTDKVLLWVTQQLVTLLIVFFSHLKTLLRHYASKRALTHGN